MDGQGRGTATTAGTARAWPAALPYLMLAGAALFWSGNWILGRAVHAEIPPLALNFWRWATASLILLPFTLTGLIAHRHVLVRHWKIMVLLAVTGVAAFHSVVYHALALTPAINALLLLAAAPAVFVAVSWLLIRERVTVRQGVGIAVSLTGAVVLIAHGDPAALAALSFNPGDLWMLIAIPLWALYSVLLRWRPTALPPLVLVAALALTGTVLLVPFYLWELAVLGPFAVTPSSVASILYVALFASVIAYIFWNRGVVEVGPNRAGLFMHLMPVFGTGLAVVLLGEPLEPFHFAGAALVFFGIYLSTRRSAR
jgi:drug/metabolite transporter (DMT)-like permease